MKLNCQNASLIVNVKLFFSSCTATHLLQYFYFQTNPDYRGTYVFDNDFPAMLEHSPDPEYVESPLFQIEKAEGKCKVICFHPKTSVTLPTMTAAEIKDVVER